MVAVDKSRVPAGAVLEMRVDEIAPAGAPEVGVIALEQYGQFWCEDIEGVVARLLQGAAEICVRRNAVVVHTFAPRGAIRLRKDAVLVESGNCCVVAIAALDAFVLLAWDRTAAETGYLKAVVRSKKLNAGKREYTAAEFHSAVRRAVRRLLRAAIDTL